MGVDGRGERRSGPVKCLQTDDVQLYRRHVSVDLDGRGSELGWEDGVMNIKLRNIKETDTDFEVKTTS